MASFILTICFIIIGNVFSIYSSPMFPRSNNEEEAGSSSADSPSSLLRRSAHCSWPNSIHELVAQLNTHLPAVHFLGPHHKLSHHCQTSGQSEASPTTARNLDTRCPFYLKRFDFDEEVNFFPRHVYVAECLCQECRGANSRSCQQVDTNITIFERLEGESQLTTAQIAIATSCACASNEVQEEAEAPAQSETRIQEIIETMPPKNDSVKVKDIPYICGNSQYLEDNIDLRY